MQLIFSCVDDLIPVSLQQIFPPLTNLAHLVTHFSPSCSYCMYVHCICCFCPQHVCNSHKKDKKTNRQLWMKLKSIFGLCLYLLISKNVRKHLQYTFMLLGINSSFALKGKRERKMYTHCTGPTHYSHMPAVQGHTHVHAHPHTKGVSHTVYCCLE